MLANHQLRGFIWICCFFLEKMKIYLHKQIRSSPLSTLLSLLRREIERFIDIHHEGGRGGHTVSVGVLRLFSSSWPVFAQWSRLEDIMVEETKLSRVEVAGLSPVSHPASLTWSKKGMIKPRRITYLDRL